MEHVIKRLEGLRRKHYDCEDRWYSCPLSEDGCCDERQEGCTCGAEEHNAEIDVIIEMLRAINGQTAR